MVNSKTIWAIVAIVLLLSVFAFGYYMINQRASSGNNDDYVTGNIIYEGVEPDVVEPIQSSPDINN